MRINRSLILSISFGVIAASCRTVVSPTIPPITSTLSYVTRLPTGTSLATTTPLPTRTKTPTQTPSPLPSETNTAEPTSTLGPTIRPENDFAFGPTPQGGHLGQITGVYVYDTLSNDDNCGDLIEVLRFYDDGLVLDVPTCLQGGFLEMWPQIKTWFHRNSSSVFSQGQYYLSKQRIWFTTKNELGATVVVDYSGTYSGGAMLLNSYSHATGNQSADIEYVRFDVDN